LGARGAYAEPLEDAAHFGWGDNAALRLGEVPGYAGEAVSEVPERAGIRWRHRNAAMMMTAMRSMA
jgi:hypothetical protein